jgi:hypothetical protein
MTAGACGSRQQRVKMLGPRSETLSDLQLQLLAEAEYFECVTARLRRTLAVAKNASRNDITDQPF